MKRLNWAISLSLPIVLLATGCAYRGAEMSDPVTRQVNWFSFVAGDDIKAACKAGAPDSYRLVYNGFWREQVRIYELGTPGAPDVLKQRILTGASISYITSADWRSLWRGVTAETPLDPNQRQKLTAALAADGLGATPPSGLRLPSDGYYWTAVACRGGQFQFNAWLYPSDRFNALSLPKVLAEMDRTGVALTPPDPDSQLMFYDRAQLERERWIIQVHEDGLSTSGSF